MATRLRENYHHRLGELTQNLLRLGSLISEAIELSMRSLRDRNLPLARQVISQDRRINALRYLIEEDAYALIATQQPMATDLRVVVSAISLATNMERMGDHAAGIAQLVLRLGSELQVPVSPELIHMAEIARRMLRESLDAYLTRNAEMARSVAADDEEVDALNNRVVNELIEKMRANSDLVTHATYMLWVAHNLERIADRVTNICERIIYIIDGELIDIDQEPEPQDQERGSQAGS